jgi:hypothetical protein
MSADHELSGGLQLTAISSVLTGHGGTSDADAVPRDVTVLFCTGAEVEPHDGFACDRCSPGLALIMLPATP